MINNSKRFQPAVVCLAAGKSQLIIIQKAKELGYAVLSVDRNPNAPGFAYSDEPIVLSTYDAKLIIERLITFQDKYRLVGVLNRSSGPPVVTAAKICQFFMLPGTPSDFASKIIDKSKLMPECLMQKINVPHCQSFSSFTEVDLSVLQFPCVVKPALSLVGKSGVCVVSKERDLSSAFDSALSASINGVVCIEEYVPGRDLSLFGLVLKGKLYSIVLRDELNLVDSGGNIHFHGMAIPSVFTGKTEENQVIRLAQEIVKNFRLERTVINLSCRCEPGGIPKLIEVHLDIGGDLFFEALIAESTSEDLLTIIIRALAGDLNEIHDIRFKPTALIYGRGEGLVSDRPYEILTAADRTALEQTIMNVC